MQIYLLISLQVVKVQRNCLGLSLLDQQEFISSSSGLQQLCALQLWLRSLPPRWFVIVLASLPSSASGCLVSKWLADISNQLDIPISVNICMNRMRNKGGGKRWAKSWWKNSGKDHYLYCNVIWDSLSFIQNWLWVKKIYTADITFSHNSTPNNTLFPPPTMLKTRALSYILGCF